MKQINTLLIASALLIASLVVSACKNEENPTTNSSTPKADYGATMSGSAERPTSTTSTATGTTSVNLNETTKVFSYTVTYSGLNPTLGHFHRITANSTTGAGGVEVPFTSLTSPITGSFTLANQARIDSFKNGYYYSNLHTAAYPNGEIRGDIKKQ